MNSYDSARMADVLAPHGYMSVSSADDADLVILNTCHIREKASEKMYSEIGRLRKKKEQHSAEGKHMAIAIAGCVAQAEAEEIARRAPAVDLVLGPQTYHRLPELVRRAQMPGRTGEPVTDTEFSVDEKFVSLPGRDAAGAVTAFLTIQEGCDKFCTFCVVPYTRGMEYSRPVAEVLEEAASLADSGVREITLLGQNVSAYHGANSNGDSSDLGQLLFTLAAAHPEIRWRYTTSHPREIGETLIAAHRDLPMLMPFLHLPVQSGSDAILNAMNRRHTADDYRCVVAELRTARPDIALSSDFIVGHPGESDEDFADTLRLVREIGFAQAYSFKYSARPGTPAADESDQVAEDVKSDRLAELQALLDSQQRSFNESFVGRRIAVLFDRPGRAPGQVAGRSPWMQAVHVVPDQDEIHSEDRALLIGNTRPVRIIEAHPNSLAGTFAGESDPHPTGMETVMQGPAPAAMG